MVPVAAATGMRRGGSSRERRLAHIDVTEVSGDSTSVLCLRGLPFSASEEDVRSCVDAALPVFHKSEEGFTVFMALDRLARPLGSAFVQWPAVSDVPVDIAVSQLSGRWIGSRYIEARPSSERELDVAKALTRQAQERCSALAPQAFAVQADALLDATAPSTSATRDVVVVCHQVDDLVSQGEFHINDLAAGRVDLLARCVAAALCYSHGVRKSVRVHLHMANARRTLSCDGARVRGLKPDERTVAGAMQRALTSCANATSAACAERGWSVRDGNGLHGLLAMLLGAPCARGADEDRVDLSCDGARPESMTCGARALLALHEKGAALDGQLRANPAAADGAVMVFGDHVGFSIEDEACLDQMNAVRVCLGPIPLLTSQCIVICQNALDCSEALRSASRCS